MANIAETAAGALTPYTTLSIIGNSSESVSFDEPNDREMQQWLVDTILHDDSTGGPVSQLWNSNGKG